jgi:60 kDa SS-A/Ro ribonucleoprotein
MSNVYENVLSTRPTQREQARPDQVQNNAGGFVFKVDDKTWLERFLILGSTDGTYYAGNLDFTKMNMQFLIDLIDNNEELVWDTIMEVSESGRAYRNSPALFALALLFRHGKQKNKPYFDNAYSADKLLPHVCRTSTHLFEFIRYSKALGGWNHSLRRAVANWYECRTTGQLAYQVVKYRQRDGWTHRDAIRLSHPKDINPVLGDFVLGKLSFIPTEFPELAHIRGFLEVQDADPKSIVRMMDRDYVKNLPWEAYPTSVHKEPDFWRRLFDNGAISGQALVRNITRLARLEMFDDMVFARDYATKLVDQDMIRGSLLHPIQYLLASVVHSSGQIDRRNKYDMYYCRRIKDWETSPIISEALDKGFHLAFQAAVPSNKRTMVSLDVSGSMSAAAMGVDLTCAELGAAMAMCIARLEPYYTVNCFSDTLKTLPIHPGMSFNEVMRITRGLNFGRTDCALPMLHALKNNIAVDTFFIFTDNETWYGDVHPYKALQQYRNKTGIPAKLIVAAANATKFSIADPNDSGMLDVVGGDANLPKLVSEFSAGSL